MSCTPSYALTLAGAFTEAWEKGRKLTVDEVVAPALEDLADA